MANIDIAKKLARLIFVKDNNTADIDLNGLLSAIQAVDTAMNATTNAAATAKPGMAVKTALLEFMQDDQPNLSSQEAGLALMLWTADQVGLLSLF